MKHSTALLAGTAFMLATGASMATPIKISETDFAADYDMSPEGPVPAATANFTDGMCFDPRHVGHFDHADSTLPSCSSLNTSTGNVLDTQRRFVSSATASGRPTGSADPSTVMLFGSGCFAVAVYCKRRRHVEVHASSQTSGVTGLVFGPELSIPREVPQRGGHYGKDD